MTPRQERFVREYLVDLNATQAAIRAGYSVKTAGQIGNENLKKPEIAAAIEKAQQDRAERTELTADWVIARLRAEAELSAEKGGTQAGRVAALNLLGKHKGMFGDRVQVEQVERVHIEIEVIDAKNPPGEVPTLPQAG